MKSLLNSLGSSAVVSAVVSAAISTSALASPGITQNSAEDVLMEFTGVCTNAVNETVKDLKERDGIIPMAKGKSVSANSTTVFIFANKSGEYLIGWYRMGVLCIIDAGTEFSPFKLPE